MCSVVDRMYREATKDEEREAESGGMRRVGGVHSCETCCLSMRVGGHVCWYFSVPARTQIWWASSMGPGLVGRGGR